MIVFGRLIGFRIGGKRFAKLVIGRIGNARKLFLVCAIGTQTFFDTTQCLVNRICFNIVSLSANSGAQWGSHIKITKGKSPWFCVWVIKR